MRIRIVQVPTKSSIDGIRLDQFSAGCLYEVGNVIGTLMLAEGWAEPVADDQPALLMPFNDPGWIYAPARPEKPPAPTNLIREKSPSAQQHPHHRRGIAADRPRRKRRR